MTRPTLKRMAVVAILATTATTASLTSDIQQQINDGEDHDSNELSPSSTVHQHQHEAHHESLVHPDEHDIPTTDLSANKAAYEGRKKNKRSRQPLIIRRLDEEISEDTTSSVVPMLHTHHEQHTPQTPQPIRSEQHTSQVRNAVDAVHPSADQALTDNIVSTDNRSIQKGATISTERNLAKQGNRAGLLARRGGKNKPIIVNINNGGTSSNSGSRNNANGGDDNSSSDNGGGGKQRNRNSANKQGQPQNTNRNNNSNSNNDNGGKKRGGIRPGGRYKQSQNNNLKRNGRFGGRLFHKRTRTQAYINANRWNNNWGTRWQSKSSKRGKTKSSKWNNSWDIDDDCWESSSRDWGWKPPAWDDDWDTGWKPPAWDDEWDTGWKPKWDDDWKPPPKWDDDWWKPSWGGGGGGWKPNKPPNWGGGGKWNDDWNGGGWGKEESNDPTLRPTQFVPTLEPTLSPTLSP